MNLISKFALGGGLFAVLAFVHFFVDWIFQSHSEAMIKHNNAKIRAKHCLIYTLGFFPLFYIFNFTGLEWLIASNILFWSHFGEDTYLLVYLWAKYIRRPPEMTEPWTENFINVDSSTSVIVHPPDPKRGFGVWAQTIMGKILLIAIDQIVHLAFLFPIVYIVIAHLK